jgi:uncharacterized protein (UPF0147 family)
MSKTKSIDRLLLALLAAGLAVGAPGCHQQGPPPKPPGVARIFDVDVNLPKLDQEFQNASPELQTTVKQIKNDARILRVTQAVALLEKLNADPSLTESQKKAISEVSEQLARVIATQEALRKK